MVDTCRRGNVRRLLQVFSFDVLSKLMLGVVGIVAIRFMSETQYATLTFALALAGVAAQALSASFNRVYLLAYETLRLEQANASFLGLQLACLGVLAVLGLPAVARFGGIYALICVLAAAICLTEYAKTFYQRDLRFMRFSLVELVRSASILLGTLSVIWVLGYDLAAKHLLTVQAVAMLAVFWLSVGRKLKLAEVAHIATATRLARQIAGSEFRYVFVYFLVIAVFAQIDVLMLKFLSGDVELATYGSAYRYYAILSLALGSLHSVLLPMIERAERGQVDEILSQHRRLTLGFGLVVASIAWAADWFMPRIDLGRYPDAVTVFRILSVSAVISFACSPHVNIIFRHRRFLFLLLLVCIALTSSLLLNTLVIPRYGAIGVAFVTLVTSAMVNLPIYLLSLRLVAAPHRIDAGQAP